MMACRGAALLAAMLVLTAGVRAAPPAPAAPATASAPAPEERAARAEAHRKLRLEYAASPAYNPYASETGESRKRASELLEEKKDFAGAIAEAAKGLEHDRFNIQLLMTKAAAHRAAGDIAQADETRQRWMALMDSILESGDGRSFETAFQVISVDEEYAVLGIFRLEMENQRLIEHEGHQYDVLEARSPKSGNTLTIYFNIDLPKQWLDKRLRGADAEAETGSEDEEKMPTPVPPQ